MGGLVKPAVTRVLMSGDAIGGVWTYSLDLSRALGERGVEVVLMTMGRRLTPEQHREAWSIPTLTVHDYPLRLEWMDDPWEDVEQAGELLLDLEERYRPDIIHLNGYAHGTLPFHARVVMVAHSCVLSWWKAVHGCDAPPEYDAYRARVSAGLRSADVVVSVTRSMGHVLQELYGPFKDARVIYNGCDPTVFLPDQKEAFIFTSGRFWDAAKNLSLLEQASSGVPWPILAAGDSIRPPGLAHVEPLSTQHVRMLGRMSRAELGMWLARAAIYALPARYEPFGLSILEAALSGCALVLGDIPSLREVWEGAALFVPAEDAAQLAGALRRLAEDADLRTRMAEAARERAQAFTLAATADAYLELYDELLDRGPRIARGSHRFRLRRGRERRAT